MIIVGFCLWNLLNKTFSQLFWWCKKFRRFYYLMMGAWCVLIENLKIIFVPYKNIHGYFYLQTKSPYYSNLLVLDCDRFILLHFLIRNHTKLRILECKWWKLKINLRRIFKSHDKIRRYWNCTNITKIALASDRSQIYYEENPLKGL